MRYVAKLLFTFLVFIALLSPALAAEPRVYVILWFDTEDYLLPASDDAALRVADWLTREGIRATFKVVGEKARTLERRGRTDVIDALKRHELGYHSNFHSTQPSPAMYLANLGWDDGVAEFDRRERPGYDDLKRIFSVAPSCYGQPGSSWGPQSFGAMKQWGMPVYLDAGSHVRLDDKPHYYGGILTLYKLQHTIRSKLKGEDDLKETEDRFAAARSQLLKEGGGIVSTYYHPCEFVHKEFWDGVNFRNGANPPREEWKLPPQKTPEETRAAYENFEGLIRFMKRFPDVQFITATEAAKLYVDKAKDRAMTRDDIKAIATQLGENVTFQTRQEFALTAGEIFLLLNQYLLAEGEGFTVDSISLKVSPLGPTSASPTMVEPVLTSWNQFWRTAADVATYIEKHQRIPGTIWLGSQAVTPEAYLVTLATLVKDHTDAKPWPTEITIRPAKLAAAQYVSDDDPKLWGWVIFPRGFKAPAMMELAKRQSWTIKPAILGDAARLKAD